MNPVMLEGPEATDITLDGRPIGNPVGLAVSNNLHPIVSDDPLICVLAEEIISGLAVALPGNPIIRRRDNADGTATIDVIYPEPADIDGCPDNLPAAIEVAPPALRERRPTRAERRRQRELDRDLARHNEQLYAVHMRSAMRALKPRRRGWLARLFTGRR